MSFFIRTLLASAIICLFSNYLFAGEGSYRPVPLLPSKFLYTVKQVDLGFNLAPGNKKASAKICSCQILNLASNNYHHNNVVLLAEKGNTGNFSSGSGAARELIEKEKKHLKLMFYDKLKVIYRTSEPTDCKSLFNRLKEENSSLVLYDILDADVRR
jgi:hypothetical protein